MGPLPLVAWTPGPTQRHHVSFFIIFHLLVGKSGPSRHTISVRPLTDEEYELLEKDILEHGQKHPILTSNDKTIYDGHNRYEICCKHGKHYKFRTIDLGNDNEKIKARIITQQMGRRNLTIFQRIECALKCKETIAAEAQKNQSAGGGPVPEKSQKPVDTSKELAKLAGCSSNTLVHAEFILKYCRATPTLILPCFGNEVGSHTEFDEFVVAEPMFDANQFHDKIHLSNDCRTQCEPVFFLFPNPSQFGSILFRHFPLSPDQETNFL
ncbi:MAG: hypothetical protein FWD31_06125 [Planctomycetaceae bacterium]|nr:hypothetical protein [Planctomycetaceae bacterium]